MPRKHCYTFQQLREGKRGYACNLYVDEPIPADIDRAKQTLIERTIFCIQSLQEGQRAIATYHIGKTYIPNGEGPDEPGNPAKLNVKGIEDHWRTREYENDGLVLLTFFGQDQVPEGEAASPEDYASKLVKKLRRHLLEQLRRQLPEQLPERFEEGPILENQDLTPGVRCATKHPRSAIFMAYAFQVDPLELRSFESLCNGERGYARDQIVNIPRHTGIEGAKQMLIGPLNHCIQRLQGDQGREIATFYIGRRYVPDVDVLLQENNPYDWGRRMKRMVDGLVVLTVVSQDNPPAQWRGTLQDYTSFLAVGLMGHLMEDGCDARLENQHPRVGRRAMVEQPKFALFMAFSFQPHPMDMDIAYMMFVMFGGEAD